MLALLRPFRKAAESKHLQVFAWKCFVEQRKSRNLSNRFLHSIILRQHPSPPPTHASPPPPLSLSLFEFPLCSQSAECVVFLSILYLSSVSDSLFCDLVTCASLRLLCLRLLTGWTLHEHNYSVSLSLSHYKLGSEHACMYVCVPACTFGCMSEPA